MSKTTMDKEGITVEKLSISWAQLLAGAFSLGMAYVCIIYTYGIAVENRTILDKRAPYIQKVDQIEKMINASTELNSELNRNVMTLNAKLETIDALRARDGIDSSNTQSSVRDLGNTVNDLKMKVIQIEAQMQSDRINYKRDKS